MDKISQKLARKPKDIHRFQHNGQIKSFLETFGLESKFAKPPTDSEPSVQTVHFGEHPTHFILIALFRGNADARDNGFGVWCLPKKRYSYEQFIAFSRRALNPTDDRALTDDILSNDPDNLST